MVVRIFGRRVAQALVGSGNSLGKGEMRQQIAHILGSLAAVLISGSVAQL
jgi:hypothetical protein